MYRIKVLRGRHVVGKEIYAPGDVFESKQDLEALLGSHRYKRLGEAETPPQLEEQVEEIQSYVESYDEDEEPEEEQSSEEEAPKPRRGRPRKNKS